MRVRPLAVLGGPVLPATVTPGIWSRRAGPALTTDTIISVIAAAFSGESGWENPFGAETAITRPLGSRTSVTSGGSISEPPFAIAAPTSAICNGFAATSCCPIAEIATAGLGPERLRAPGTRPETHGMSNGTRSSPASAVKP